MNGRCDPIGALSPTERAACRELLQRHFVGVDAAGFEADLADKTHVLRLLRGGELLGFTTLAVRELEDEGRTIVELFSGDTVMDPRAWSAAALAPAWFAACWPLAGARGLPAYWLLICSGVRTYRLLTLFWERFVPHPTSDDLELLALRERLARRRFGARYDRGVVRLERPQRLRPHLAGVPEHYRSDHFSTHFLACNPGHEAGDELVCLSSFTLANLSRAGRRIAQRVGVLDPAGIAS